jgi:hypothetical protein
MSYNQIYGKYSLGTGSWVKKEIYNKEIYHPEIIDTYKTQVLRDLCRMKIQNNIKNMEVLDVGTGRQALAFFELGAKKVDLYDISKNNIKNFSKFNKNHSKKIKSYCLDIGTKNFFKINKKYDLIYLHGVIQHTKNPIYVIRNLALKLRVNGFFWFYHYQLGSLENIIYYLIKLLVNKSGLSISFIYKSLSRHLNKKDLCSILDTVGCDYMHLLPNEFYLEVLKYYGFKIVYSKDFYINQKCSIRITEPSCLLGLKRTTKKFSIKNFDTNKKLIPNTDSLILDYRNYVSEDQKTIKYLNYLLKKINYNLTKKKQNKVDVIKSIILLDRNVKENYLLRPYNEKIVSLKDSFEKVLRYVE